MNLDVRAARATRSLRASVSGAAPVHMSDVVARHRRSMVTTLVATAALLVMLVGIASAMPAFFEPDQVATDATLPDDGTPLVVEPDDKETEGELVELDDLGESVAVRQTHSSSDSPQPYTVFYGDAEPGSIVSAVSAFAEGAVTVGESGTFELKLWFDPIPPAGETFPIVVTADGVPYEFQFTSQWDPENIAVTAHQTYGASDDAEAFEKLFGTAPPGTPVVATSPYGSAETVAGEEGYWGLALRFSELPLDEPFDITVAVGEETFTFPFVSVFELPPPPVTVSQVNTVSDSSSPFTQFVGTAPPGTHLLAKSSYGSNDAVVGESGEFSLKVWFSPLPPAGKAFPITFMVDHEPHATFSFTSLYEPKEASAAVTVEQYNTSSDSSDPWVKFAVSAPKGTVVQIVSEYGSTSRTMESTSEYVKLFFSTLPPAGVEFQVKVKIDGELFGAYPFTSWFDPEGAETVVEPIVTSSDSSDPYAKVEYWAPAGTTIALVSEYGSASTTTSGTGSGHLKLWFTELPPAGVEFPVTIQVNGETYGSFGFTSWYEASGTEVTVQHAAESSSADPPYDDLWGTAPEGTHIDILSPYGSQSLSVGASETWEKRLHFEGAPYGEPFTVKVKVNGEIHTTYQFTVYEAG